MSEFPPRPSDFDGLICSYPLCSFRGKTLTWEMQHGIKQSKGGYVVTQPSGRRKVFRSLGEAIEYFNEGTA